MPQPSKPTPNRFTFSIKSILIATTVVALWACLYQHSPVIATAYSGAAIVISCGCLLSNLRVFFWLPVMFIATSESRHFFGPSVSTFYDAAFYFGFVAIAIGCNTVYKTKRQFQSSSDLTEFTAAVIKHSTFGSIWIGLYSALVIVAYGAILEKLNTATLLFGGAMFISVFTILFALLGLMLSLPLVCVCGYFLDTDTPKRMANDGT